MAVYEYLALEADGRQTKGLIEADTPRQARAQLRNDGLIPVELEPVVKKSPNNTVVTSRRRIKRRNLALITGQLAVLLRSGLPLEEALQAVSRQVGKPALSKILADIRTQLLEGRSLSQSIARYPLAFPPLYQATVEAGEASGKLDRVLEKLALYIRDKEQLQQKMQLALIYPLILTLVSIAVIIGLLTYVVPEIVAVFEDTGQSLPGLTQGLIAISGFLKEKALVLIAAISGIWILGYLLMRTPTIKHWVHRLLLVIPLFANYIRCSNTARFARTMAILTSSGVTLLEALQITGQVIQNLPMRKAVERGATRVREGMSLNQALEESALFPLIAIHLIHSGEMSGQLPEMLETLADNQEQEIYSLNEWLIGLFEPALILLMGGVVLAIVLAILMPIFEMNQLVM